jgi:hypothetical protein
MAKRKPKAKPGGRIEQAIVDCLRGYPGMAWWPRWISAQVFKADTPTTAQIVSVRRALRSLQRKDLVERVSAARGRRDGSWKLKEAEPRRRRRQHSEDFDERLSQIVDIPPKAPTEDKQKLVMILGMLGSEHDGEIVVAARQAEKLRRKLGMTWEQLLSLG